MKLNPLIIFVIVSLIGITVTAGKTDDVGFSHRLRHARSHHRRQHNEERLDGPQTPINDKTLHGMLNSGQDAFRGPKEEAQSKKPGGYRHLVGRKKNFGLYKLMKHNNLEKIVKFKFSAKRLPKTDTATKIDPYVVVSITDKFHKEPIVLGQTPVIMNNENPIWGKEFSVFFSEKTKQRLHFSIYDKDFKGKDQLVGTASTRLSLFGKNKLSLTLPVFSKFDKPESGAFPTLMIKKVI